MFYNFQVPVLEVEDLGVLQSLRGDVLDMMSALFVQQSVGALEKHDSGYDGTLHRKIVEALNKIDRTKAKFREDSSSNSNGFNFQSSNGEIR